MDNYNYHVKAGAARCLSRLRARVRVFDGPAKPKARDTLPRLDTAQTDGHNDNGL